MPDWSYHRMNGLPMNLKGGHTTFFWREMVFRNLIPPIFPKQLSKLIPSDTWSHFVSIMVLSTFEKKFAGILHSLSKNYTVIFERTHKRLS